MREIHVSNVPFEATEEELKRFLEGKTAEGAVKLCELRREQFRPRHRGFGFATFAEDRLAEAVRSLALSNQLYFRGRPLRINVSTRRVQGNPTKSTVAVTGTALSMGCLAGDIFNELWSTESSVDCEFDFRDRKLYMSVTIPTNHSLVGSVSYHQYLSPKFKIEFPFKDMVDTCRANVVGSRSGRPSWLLELWYPPRIHQLEDSSLENLFHNFVIYNHRDQQPWFRTVDFTGECSIGQSFAYLLEFSDETSFSGVLFQLEDYKLVKQKTRTLQVKKGPILVDTSPGVIAPLLQCPSDVGNIPFDVMFTLNHLVQVGNLCGPTLTPRFFRLLSETPEQQALWAIRTLARSETMLSDPERWLEEALHRFPRGGVRLDTPITPDDGAIWDRRIQVSPTKLYCVDAEMEVSNRVTREYTSVIDNFIRISFVEEDGSNLSSQALIRSGNRESDILKRVRRVLKEGIRVQGKQYEFLAFSASQLREHSVWMFARTGLICPESIRRWMGSFLRIRNVAKCAARMGQCFSSTTKTLAVEWSEVESIDDVLTADGKYCFSDGIGKISASFAKRVGAKCGQFGTVPSAFQIRYGGFKGVVAVCRTSLHKLSLRPSMKKFESDQCDLEVISWTKRIPCYLNRQIITLLSTLGIRDAVFEQLQSVMLSKLADLLTYSNVALDFLQMTGAGASHQIMVSLLKAGYGPSVEPFLRGLLEAFRAFQMLQLRTKARIFVAKGRTLMGCLDETRTLFYGQAFVQVTGFPGTRSVVVDGLQYGQDGTCVLKGRVVVAKNPCLHPGDVRVLEAVDVPELHHMVDCVVFPQRGSRPHPNECSGSDLDGDLYFVSWDRTLVPLQTDEPSDYTPPPAIELPTPVTIVDIEDFFVKYMKTDALGVISNAHVVHADTNPSMARDPICLEIARLFNQAVDFPKTGTPAVMRPELRAQTYPDFMEKSDKVSYKSKKVLGMLYREVVGEARETRPERPIMLDEIVSSFDRDLVWPDFEYHVDEAAEFKFWYDSKLLGLMNQYDIQTEAEAISGNILQSSKFYAKRLQSEMRDRLQLAVRSLQSEARGWFKRDALADYDARRPSPGLEALAFAKASAWYHVTYHRRYLSMATSVTEDGCYFLSFPWVVHDTLLAMKKRRRRRQL